jgi:phosphatidylethanolamine-binding protein (PEBP) family uncharacterized protein
MVLSSSVFQAGRPVRGEHAIPASYTCDGSDVAPAMTWTGVPPGTAELLLIIVDTTASRTQRVFTWAVAGLSPTLRGIATGSLPAGAIVGRNGFGQSRYSVCPHRGDVHLYGIVLYALPRRLPLRPGFEPNRVYEKVSVEHLPEAQSGFAYKRI